MSTGARRGIYAILACATLLGLSCGMLDDARGSDAASAKSRVTPTTITVTTETLAPPSVPDPPGPAESPTSTPADSTAPDASVSEPQSSEPPRAASLPPLCIAAKRVAQTGSELAGITPNALPDGLGAAIEALRAYRALGAAEELGPVDDLLGQAERALSAIVAVEGDARADVLQEFFRSVGPTMTQVTNRGGELCPSLRFFRP